MKEYDSTRPIYLQIMEKIKSQIILEEIKPSEKLLSIRDMAVEMGVNPNTMTRVYTELEREGIVETKRGSGTFVVEEPDLVERLKDEFMETNVLQLLERIREMGFTDKQILTYVKKALKIEEK